MKVHCYLLCFNEEKMIESVLRYYSEFCSKIFVMDNYSTDRSVEVARKFPMVSIIKWKTDDGKIDERMYVRLKSQMYKEYSREGGRYTEEVADWIISCDMDEILYHPDIKSILEDYKSKGVTVPQITGFNMVGDHEVDPARSIAGQYQYGFRSPHYDKRIVFDCEFNMAYSVGCHPAGVGFEYMKTTYGYKSSNEHPLALLHFKRVGDRLVDKAAQNVDRIDRGRSGIRKTQDGSYKGLGGQYFNVVEGKAPAPEPAKMRKVIGDDGQVLFADFKPSTGEAGSKKIDDVPLKVEKRNIKVFASEKSSPRVVLKELSDVLFKNSRKIAAENVKALSEKLNIETE
ncbi:glycosyltransferase family 2 protein [Marinobacter sp. MBR-105]|jgi:hypothetical protein